ncbi:hypothetical protein D3C75_537680 [compost metagenome]
MGGRGEDGQGVLDQVAQVEGDAVEHQLAGLDLGEVEDLVDDPQQVVGGLLDSAQVVQLARCQLAFLQQVGETEDAVERGADFVAHVGQEFRLDAAGLQGFLARHVQLDVLDLDGFQVLAHVLGGLVDTVLQLFVGVVQGFGHAVDAARQLVQLMAAHGRQAFLEVAVLELVDCVLDALDRVVDGAAHAQCQQAAEHQTGEDQQQAGEQVAVAAQQGAVVGQLDLDPAQQAFGFGRHGIGGQVAMVAEHRHQVACGVIAAALQQLGAGAAAGWLVEHARAGVGQARAVRGQEGDRAHIGLLQGLRGNALKLCRCQLGHGGRGQRRQLLGDHLAALQQLGAQVVLLQPGEVTTQHQGHQAGRQQGQQQDPAANSQAIEHTRLLSCAWTPSSDDGQAGKLLRLPRYCTSLVRVLRPCRGIGRRAVAWQALDTQ